MEQYQARAVRPSHGANWPAGQRAWSMVRSLAAIDSDSIVRRTMRQSRANAAVRATAPEVVVRPAPILATPHVVRFRAKLMAGPHDRAVQGAKLLLELAEPDSWQEARRGAFPSGASSPEAELALAQAWEQFRHDRYRALN